ncbi:MAG: hypothetical protein ACRKGH_08780 [Dehalogenimonas sp.]
MSLQLRKYLNRLIIIGISLILSLATLGIPATTNKLSAATTVSINMIYYGWHSPATEAAIINANPTFLVSNSPAGPWRGNANISKFTAAGIKYFEYIDGGYEGTRRGGIPVDLQSNLNYITAAAAAGAYGIFLDQVSEGIWTTPNWSYLQQISAKARSLGLKIVFNTGQNSWSDQLMTYCDYINSSEQWSNASLTASQQKWASRTWLLREGVYDATTAANLTQGAWSKGVLAAYVTPAYASLAYWLPSYVSLISPYTPSAPAPTPSYTPSYSSLGNTTAMVTSVPIPTGASNEYSLSVRIMTSANAGLTAGQTVWIAATTTDFPSLRTIGSTITGNMDNSYGWWVLKNPTTPVLSYGNITAVIASAPTPSGGSNEFSFSIRITTTTVSGLTVGQVVWVAATTIDFPNLHTIGYTVSGNLDKSLGWWTLKAP